MTTIYIDSEVLGGQTHSSPVPCEDLGESLPTLAAVSTSELNLVNVCHMEERDRDYRCCVQAKWDYETVDR